jgi:hypothetical protein
VFIIYEQIAFINEGLKGIFYQIGLMLSLEISSSEEEK